eukprot:scaffold298641_cov41-Prasinocladus_malaysianus.AAC.1
MSGGHRVDRGRAGLLWLVHSLKALNDWMLHARKQRGRGAVTSPAGEATAAGCWPSPDVGTGLPLPPNPSPDEFGFTLVLDTFKIVTRQQFWLVQSCISHWML